MQARPANSSKSFDWTLIAVYLSLVAIGWLMLYSAFYDPEQPYAMIDFTTPIGRQTMWVGIAITMFIFSLNIEWNFWNTFAYPIYFLSMALLLMVLIFGSVKNGAKSWFDIGFLSFQPAEVAKLGTCFAIASFLNSNKNNFSDTRILGISIGVFLLPIVLILLQPDPGSALVFLSFFILLYRRGLSSIYYLVAGSLGTIFIVSLIFSTVTVVSMVLYLTYALLLLTYRNDLLTLTVLLVSVIGSFIFYNQGITIGVWLVPLIGLVISALLNFRERNLRVLGLGLPTAILATAISFGTNWVFDNVLEPHQQERINVWLNPSKCDPRGSLYNVLQSKLTIGSGGLEGKGFLEGEMTKLKFVPEQTTDFIFTIVGEEQGFIGALGVIVLFVILIVKAIAIAERARLEFIRNYAYGVAGVIFVHFIVNIGMTMGLMPVVGIPLPLVSKGGTSLVIFTIMIGALIKMDQQRSLR